MTKYRNYWIYSIGCFVIWGVPQGRDHPIFLRCGLYVNGAILRLMG